VCSILSKVVPISQVDISCFAHATEDESKVLDALRHLLPRDHVDKIIFTRNKMHGHHGNPITLFESKIKEKNVVRSVVDNLALNLSPLDKETLLNEVGLHFEKGSLYIRLDKQAAFDGEFKLTTADPVRVRLRFKKNRLEDVIELCREIGMFPR
jgi:RNA binding exosome subunit